ncbi:hypothetical protein PV327_003343 [Microctonus hyperodae]|uniref:Uncharacterized protein n=1 Tax=Microctonus hyperodae TaxID=165561 RepID=A0AA39G4R9_MICHY|nr:hypothetical protein PV327_003343 [Microctonus hyperodae]
MRSIIVGLLVIFLINPEGNAQLPFSISDMWTVIKWCDGLVNKGVSYKSAVDTITDNKNQEELEKILNEVEKISLQLESFANKIDQKLDGILNTLLNNLRDNIILQFTKTQLNDLFNTIDRLHNKAMTLRFRGQFGETILRNFVKSILWDSNNVPETLERINQLILPSTNYVVPPFIQLILKDAQDNLQYDCNQYMSAQQRMYYIYTHIILSEMQGLTTLNYAYSIQQMIDRSYNYSIELENAKDLFRNRVTNYYKYLSKTMMYFPREIHRCDPNPEKRDIDFFQLYKFSQAAIFNERNLTSGLKSHSWNRGYCDKTCPELNSSTFGSDIQTLGKTIYNCQYLGGPVKFCPAPADSYRDYNWWKTSQSTFGLNKKCDKELDMSGYREENPLLGVHVDLYDCDTCVCSVDMNTIENRSTDETAIASISITPQISDILNNMIVTGVKFIVDNRAVHIQIQENKFLPGGIASNNSSWKDITHRYITSNKIKQDEGIKYAAFDHKWKTLLLDDIMLPNDYVITGLRFVRKNRTSSFMLKVHGTLLNFSSGFLDSKSSKWFSFKDSDKKSAINNRKSIKLTAPDDPTRCLIYDYDKGTHKSIKFQHTDIHKDAGQNTIPFFDAQSVEAQPPFPLNGIGLFHRHKNGFGGYIAPRIFTTEVSKNIKTKLMKESRKSKNSPIPQTQPSNQHIQVKLI